MAHSLRYGVPSEIRPIAGVVNRQSIKISLSKPINAKGKGSIGMLPIFPYS